MSLEAAITRLADLTEKQNGLLEKLLGSAAMGTPTADGAASGDADKPKPGRKKADKPAETTSASGDNFEISYADLKKKLAPWLGEFAKDEDKENPAGAHPEVAARRDALKECFKKLGVSKLDEMEKVPEKLAKLNKWLETKAKVDDHVGAGAGRFAADPEASEDDDSSGSDLDDL